MLVITTHRLQNELISFLLLEKHTSLLDLADILHILRPMSYNPHTKRMKHLQDIYFNEELTHAEFQKKIHQGR